MVVRKRFRFARKRSPFSANFVAVGKKKPTGITSVLGIAVYRLSVYDEVASSDFKKGVYMSGLVLLKGIESRHLQAASPVSSSFDGDGGSRSKGSPKVSPNTTSDNSNLGVL